MIPESIAVEPTHGWGGIKTAQSKIGFQWLFYQNNKLGGNRIKHAGNFGEHTIMLETYGKVRVDGYDPIKKTVNEFHGTDFHGCKKCKPNSRQLKTWYQPDRTVDEMYELTKKKTALLQAAGYTVIEEGECKFKCKLASDANLQALVEDLTWVVPLNTKDALFGVRTGLSCSYYKAKKNEWVDYIDFTSLYPSINKYGTYLVGHQTIMKNPVDQDIHSYFGAAKVDILAPEKLFPPVLPMKIGDKFMFTLCATCAKEQLDHPWYQRTNMCSHSDEERTMTGTWCTEELKMAVRKGYTIFQIHEVWHGPESQTKTGLFAPYVKKFLKAKQESSGWPSDCVTDEQKEAYIAEYEAHEGVLLDKDKIMVNPGRKAVAKVMLNSFWGKFCEADNKPQTRTLQNASDWDKLMADDSVIVKSINVYNEDVLEVVTVKKDRACAPNVKGNIFVALFTTALARLKLYEELQKLEERVLYYDTASVIYRWKTDQVKLPLSKFLGQFTDELEGGHIDEFCAPGPRLWKVRQSAKATASKAITLSNKC